MTVPPAHRSGEERDAVPILSFVIPTYNRAALLTACLDALYGEQGAGIPFEVIIVDDGATDETVAVVQRAQARWGSALRLLQQENSGPAIARNRGVEAAQGELIVF